MDKAIFTVILALAAAAGLADKAAAAPASFTSDHPVQLVVLGTKALKALGIHLPHRKYHQQQHQQHHQHHPTVQGNSSEEIPALVVNLPAHTTFPHHQHNHRRCRHNHRCRCPPGMKKDISGKCRKIWGP